MASTAAASRADQSSSVAPATASTLDIGNAAGRRAPGPAHQPGHGEYCHQVGQHGHELAGYRGSDDGHDALQVVRETEEQRGEEGSDRVPPAEDQGGQRDKAAPAGDF